MSEITNFDWNGWYEQFNLPPQALAECWNIYPTITTLRQMGQAPQQREPMPLSQHVIAALLAAGARKISVEESFNHYLEIGEIAAATLLLEQVAASSMASSTTLQHRVSQFQQAVELKFAQLRAQTDQFHQTLVALGVQSQEWVPLQQACAKAELLYQQQRIGAALAELQPFYTLLSTRYDQQRAQLAQQLEQLRTQAEREEAAELRAAALQQLGIADDQFRHNQLVRADRGTRTVELLLESKDIAYLPEQFQQEAGNTLRGDFPDIHARTIVEALDQATLQRPGLASFVASWCPVDWRGGQRPRRQTDPTYPIYEALRNLAQLSAPGCPYPFAPRSNPWGNFLNDLYDLIGKRGLGPASVEPLATRNAVGAPLAGFWLGYASSSLTIPFTFLDPARIPDGLPVILWHRPNDPLCPKPANLHNELFAKKSLNRRPLLVIAGDQIAPEDRDALQRAVPTAALIDERDLLRIIFCSDQPEVRAMHFAQTIAWQLPANFASPYGEQADVSSALFVGREDVLSELLDSAGPTVLYGGRKLGKSSIFRQIERIFSNQDRNHIAIYFNAVNIVDDIGIERSFVTGVGNLLNSRLRGLQSGIDDTPIDLRFPNVYSKTRDMCEEFTASLRRMLAILPNYRFLLLIDEADSLLQYLDTPNDPIIDTAKRFGWTLRALVQESGGRLDVRFAGFQEISRAAQSPSGPFYNFRPGVPQRALTVLQPDEARALIVNPLRMLGATFADESLVEFILDVTGQHPALIQAFCSRLYRRVRGTRRDEHYTLAASHVEAIWQDPQFRKDVIRAIHLNVETRNTKPEKILRLVLYLWVREIMAPNTRAPLPLICEPVHLYQLLCDTFGREAVEHRVCLRLADLDNYLADLATLGVLAQLGRGYIFRYRYFANLLYHDHFGGQLNETVVRDLWSDIVDHNDLSPRFQIQVNDQLSISPFTRENQSALEQERQHVVFALGASGTGKSEFFRWLETNRARQSGSAETVHILDVADKPVSAIRAAISGALGLAPPANWQQFANEVLAHVPASQRPLLIVLDGVNSTLR